MGVHRDDEELPKPEPHWRQIPDAWNMAALVPALLIGLSAFGRTFDLITDWWEGGTLTIVVVFVAFWSSLSVGGFAMLASF